MGAEPNAAEFQIIELQSQPIGRMIVLRQPGSWHLVDISLPEYRAHGMGGEVIRSLMRECKECGAGLKLQVLNTNPARRLYERLGFIRTGEDQIYTHMEFRS